MLQDIVRQVQQGSAKVLQAVDWPQSSPEGQKDQDDHSGDDESPAETGTPTEVCTLSIVSKETLQRLMKSLHDCCTLGNSFDTQTCLKSTKAYMFYIFMMNTGCDCREWTRKHHRSGGGGC